MLVTNHVLSGAVIGALLQRFPGRTPAAFTAGIASHFALDAVPHWGTGPGEDFLPVAVRDGFTGLAAIGLLMATTRRDRWWPVVAGMAGAALPDVNKPSELFFGRSPFPAAVDRFHVRVQRESPGRMPQEFAVGSGLLLLALVLARR